jgi:hypothetical protein
VLQLTTNEEVLERIEIIEGEIEGLRKLLMMKFLWKLKQLL